METPQNPDHQLTYAASTRGLRFPGTSPNTSRSYITQWRLFSDWTLQRRMAQLPASPDTVATYLSERGRRGVSFSTIRASATAIAAVHRIRGFQTPTHSLVVRSTIRELSASQRRPTARTKPLTFRGFQAIRSTALTRRIGRGGLPESRRMARRRGQSDIALTSLLIDASLGRSEVAALTWGDVLPRSKGRGIIRVRSAYARSEKSAERILISLDTMRALRAIRMKTFTSDMPVFGLSESQIHRRIKAAASAAGLGDGYGGNSGRAAAMQARRTRKSRDVLSSFSKWLSAQRRNPHVTHGTIPSLSPAERLELGVKPDHEPRDTGAERQRNSDSLRPAEEVSQRQNFPNATPET